MIAVHDQDRIGLGATCELRDCHRDAARRITIYRPPRGTPDWVDVCGPCLARPEVQEAMRPPTQRPAITVQPPRRAVLALPQPPGESMDPMPPRRDVIDPNLCNVSECGEKPRPSGLCKRHYNMAYQRNVLPAYRTPPAARVCEPQDIVPQVSRASVDAGPDLPTTTRITPGGPIVADGVVVALGNPAGTSPVEYYVEGEPGCRCDVGVIIPDDPAHPRLDPTADPEDLSTAVAVDPQELPAAVVVDAPVTEMGAGAIEDGLGQRVAGGQIRKRISLEAAEEELLREETALRARMHAFHQLRLLPRVEGIREIRITLIGDGWSDSGTLSEEPAEDTLPAVYAVVRSALTASVLAERRRLIDIAFPGQWVTDEVSGG